MDAYDVSDSPDCIQPVSGDDVTSRRAVVPFVMPQWVVHPFPQGGPAQFTDWLPGMR
jgi:hypothetical protein